jgi:hypothetical protein
MTEEMLENLSETEFKLLLFLNKSPLNMIRLNDVEITDTLLFDHLRTKFFEGDLMYRDLKTLMKLGLVKYTSWGYQRSYIYHKWHLIESIQNSLKKLEAL